MPTIKSFVCSRTNWKMLLFVVSIISLTNCISPFVKYDHKQHFLLSHREYSSWATEQIHFCTQMTFSLSTTIFYLKHKPDFQRGNKNHKGELHQILCTGTCLFISKVRRLLGRSHAAEMVLVWSVARPVRCMLGGKWPRTTCQMLEKFQLSHSGR